MRLRLALAGFGIAFVTSSLAHAAPGWAPEQQIVPADAKMGDSFGQSVALSGTTAIVGAPYASGGGGAGVAYVFVHSGATWSEEARLAPTEIVTNDSFGRAVALGGDTALIGAPSHATRCGSIGGAAPRGRSRRSSFRPGARRRSARRSRSTATPR